jgi:hypothetical protein
VGLAALLVLLLAGALPEPARADVFGPVSLASAGVATVVGEASFLQADYAHDPAISGNGRYVAFDGSIGGVIGVWRRDLETGEIEQVAGGDAELPSISSTGQYISFTTNEGASLDAITNGQTDEHPQKEAVNVYVRNMDVPISETGPCEAAQCPFRIASARTGSEEPLSYAGPPATMTSFGSVAAGRSALSADGQEVAFVTTAVSDLADPEAPAEPKTPALQVAVRYMQTDTTELVSGRYDASSGQTTAEPVSGAEGATPFGAVYQGSQVYPFAPVPSYGGYGEKPPPGASISADGSTVAWMGADIAEQVPLLSEEKGVVARYAAPLWRRIAPGSQTPTEQVTGGSDPLNPACLASGETELPQSASPSDPCQGPFVPQTHGNPGEGILAGTAADDFIPRLSADGYTVAFMAQAPLVALGHDFGRPGGGQPSDLYVADMHPGLTRTQALAPITELAGAETAGIAYTGPIVDFDISPSGEQVAFTTRRTQFPLGEPAYISPASPEPGLNELFDADLADETVTRVTHGVEGGPGEHTHKAALPGEDPYANEGDGALSPSFSEHGDKLAFSSTAANLVYGDGNTPIGTDPPESFDGSDAFVVERTVFGEQPTRQFVSGVSGDPPAAPSWKLGVTAASRRDGSVALYVEVPGAGVLRAGAQGAVALGLDGLAPSSRSVKVRRARRSSRYVAAGRAGRHVAAARHGKHAHALVALRTVAQNAARTAEAGLVILVLKLGKPYAALAAARGGLSASAQLSFAAPGHPTQRSAIEITFLRHGSARRGSRGARR